MPTSEEPVSEPHRDSVPLRNTSDVKSSRGIVTVPSAFGARNVFHSGLFEQLSDAVRVVVAVPPNVRHLVESTSASEVWDLPDYRPTRKHTVVLESLRDAFFDRYRINSRDILLKHRHRYKKKSIRSRVGEAAYRCLAPLGRFRSSYAWLETTEEKLFSGLISEDLKRRLREADIRFGLSTVFVTPNEWLLARALQEVGIPTATHILSFDNLTSMGYRPLKRFDLYLVWSERMARELVDFYDIPRKKIEVTGTPQFDFHVLDGHRLDREKTCEALGLRPNEPFVVYCANTVRQTPREPELLLHILEAFKREPRLKCLQWIVRLHPYDDYERWDSVVTAAPQVKLHHPWAHPVRAATYWGALKDDDISMLGNTLRHSSLAMSIGSTIALDCAVVNAPIVSIGFHPDQGSAEDKYYFNVHRSYHYTPITESNAAPVALSTPELVELAREAIEEPEKRSAYRKRLSEIMCGTVDGHAADRIFGAVKDRFL